MSHLIGVVGILEERDPWQPRTGKVLESVTSSLHRKDSDCEMHVSAPKVGQI